MNNILMDHIREFDDAFSDIADYFVIPVLKVVLGVALLILRILIPMTGSRR